MSLYDEVEELLKDHQPFHSELQIDAFITAQAGGTRYGQFKQALREIASRWAGLRGRYVEREQLLGELKVLQSSDRMTDRDGQIELARKSIQLDELERSIRDGEREFARFKQHGDALKKEIGELTPERRRELELEFWEHRLRTQIAVSLLSSGRVPATIIEMLPFLPDGPRDAIEEALDNPQRTIQWFRGLRIELPALPEIEYWTERDVIGDELRERGPKKIER